MSARVSLQTFLLIRLNSGRIIRLFARAGPILRTCVQYLMTFFSRPEAASDVISGRFVMPIVLDKCVKFRDRA